MVSLHFNRTFRSRPGTAVEMTDGVRRLTAPNTGPMTFTGTNSYLVGHERLAVIDPGPDDASHLEALITAIGGAPVEAIVVTHTHRDHSPLARALQAETGAPIVGAGPHRQARDRREGEPNVDAVADLDHQPDTELGDGKTLDLGGFTLRAVATPGHTMNHLCFALSGTPYLFSGDHVMAWSTTLVAPPDGAMTPYLESLQKLARRPESIYLPGHGARIDDAAPYVDALYAHRMEREASILAAIECDALDTGGLVDRLYEGLDPRLRGAAALSVLAHLERLEAYGQAQRMPGGAGLWTAQGMAFDSPD